MRYFLVLGILISANVYSMSFKCLEARAESARTVILTATSTSENLTNTYDIKITNTPNIVELAGRGEAVINGDSFVFETLDQKASVSINLSDEEEDEDDAFLRFNNKISRLICQKF